MARSCFSRSSTRQPSISGSEMSSRIACGWYSRGERNGRGARRRDHALEARPCGPSRARTARSPDRCRRSARHGRRAESNRDRRRTSLSSSNASSASATSLAVDVGVVGVRRRRGRLRRRRAHARRTTFCGTKVCGKIERERAAHAGRADQPDLAAEQPGDFAADRQAQARAAVLAARAAVGLLERLEDDLLLVRRNADAGVASPRTPITASARVERCRCPAFQPSSADVDVEATPGRDA